MLTRFLEFVWQFLPRVCEQWLEDIALRICCAIKKLPIFVKSISDFYITTGLAKTLMFDMEGVFLGEV